MSECIYDSSEGEFVDFETLDDWEQRDKAKNARISALEAQLAQRDAALKAADKLAATVDVIRCSDKELRAVQSYRKARGQDAD